MPRDPIDDLLSTPDGTVSPFDPLEADVPQDVAKTVFRAMGDDAKRRLTAHLDRFGLDGDVVGLSRRRSRVQQAIDALDWVSSQPGPTVTLGCYPVDLDAENAHFEKMLEEHPDFRDVHEDDLPIPRDRSPEDITRELQQRIRDLEANKPDDEE